MLRLSATHDGHVREAELPPEPTDLGASTDCGICLPFPGVSRHHARVEPTKGGVRLIDLGSKNGLKQKGRRLAEVILRPGESVHLGRARLTLEEIDTSDAILGAPSLHRSAPPVVHETGDGDTDTIASDGLDSTPGEALRLIREIEISGVALNGPRGSELLDRAARVLGATSLFTVTSSKQGAALRRLNGATPSEEHLRVATEMAGQAADDEVISREVGDGVSMIMHPLGSASEGLLLVALLAATQARLKPWRRDLFGYVAQRLQPEPVRKPAVPRPHASATLSLPEGFVRGRSHARDPSNSDLRFARARVRAEVLPGLLGLDPRFVEHVGAVCDELVALRRQASGAPATAELEGLGRRSRDALQRLARGDARKMAVQLPKQRTATYDPSVGRLVLHAPEAPAGPTDPAPCPGPARAPRKLP